MLPWASSCFLHGRDANASRGNRALPKENDGGRHCSRKSAFRGKRTTACAHPGPRARLRLPCCGTEIPLSERRPHVYNLRRGCTVVVPFAVQAPRDLGCNRLLAWRRSSVRGPEGPRPSTSRQCTRRYAAGRVRCARKHPISRLGPNPLRRASWTRQLALSQARGSRSLLLSTRRRWSGSVPEGTGRTVGHTRRCAAGCRKHQPRKAGPATLVGVPEGALEGFPEGIPLAWPLR